MDLVAELSDRERRVLQWVVEAYIADAQPVSSGSVVERCRELNLSSASIRNTMAQLEDKELLCRAHSSAGRIPTRHGLRFYLDELMSPKLHPWDGARLSAAAEAAGVSDFPSHLGQGLVGLTGQMAVVAMPQFLGSQFREVGLVRCGPGRFMVVFVSQSGFVQQKLVEVGFDLEQQELVQIQNILNAKLAGRTLAQVRNLIERELERARDAYDTLNSRALQIGERALPEPELELVVEGAVALGSQPEFSDVEKLRALMRTIEEKRALLTLLDEVLRSQGPSVVLGSETGISGVELACVGSPWLTPAGNRGVIAMVGSSRMDYGRLVSLVSYATKLFERYWQSI